MPSSHVSAVAQSALELVGNTSGGCFYSAIIQFCLIVMHMNYE